MIERREFLEKIVLSAGAGAIAGCAGLPFGRERMNFGCCCGPDDVAELADVGYDFWEWNVGAALVPAKGADEWAANRKKILSAPIPMASCNGFLPGSFRLTGPKRDFAAPLEYAVTACRRADEVGLPVIVFGSGGARNAPEGYPLDKARAEFTEFCRRLVEKIDGCRVTLALEPLQPAEANYLNYVREGVEIMKAVGSPRVRVLADIYHMMQGGETADSILLAGADLRHCHIAEKGTRHYPSCDPARAADYAPYFAALREIGYTGGVSCECGWPCKDKQELRAARAKALVFMKNV